MEAFAALLSAGGAWQTRRETSETKWPAYPQSFQVRLPRRQQEPDPDYRAPRLRAG